MRGKPVDRFCFQVDGDVVDPDSTPENLDLDNDDTIDVVEKNDKDVWSLFLKTYPISDLYLCVEQDFNKWRI